MNAGAAPRRATAMGAPSELNAASRLLRDPRAVAAAVAIAVRAAVAAQAHAHGALVPALDGAYYLDWAGDLAAGDYLGRTGTIHGEAFLFNPLYAYVLAPLVGVAGKSALCVAVFQALLAGATAALAAGAARRFAGRIAGWCAGLAVALSTALVHLDGKVAVSGLAAFLVAGAVWSLSPEPDAAGARRGHGPFASGVWLGLSLLARPVMLPAVIFALWLHARRTPRRARAAVLLLVPVAFCSALSFSRNLVVAGEPVVFTAANGQNLHLGNNPVARRVRSMATDEFRFGPVAMHDDAKYRVAFELHREPSRAEISSWFTRRAIDDFAAAPGESLAWYAAKLGLFAGPKELGSSDEIDADRASNPFLVLACVPTWLLVALAAGSLAFARRRSDVLLGPGAIVASHALACVLVYPLSHYRSPCIPALAVMAGIAFAEAIAALRVRRAGPALAAFALAAIVGVSGLLASPPPYFAEAKIADEAAAALAQGDEARADELALRSLETSPDDVQSLTVRLIVANRQQRFADANAFASHLTHLRPWDPDALTDLAWSNVRLGLVDNGLEAASAVVELYPWSAKVRSARGAMRIAADDLTGGREDLRWALDHGFTPPPWALERAGL